MTTPHLHPGEAVLADMAASGGTPQELLPGQIQLLRQMYEDRDVGLYLFARHIFGYKDITEEVHLPISAMFGRWGETHLRDGRILTEPPTGEVEPLIVDSWRRLMIRIPREMYKSSFCTRAGALWAVCRSPGHDATVGIFNEKEENAERWVGAIAEVVESSRLFQMLWPEMLPPGISLADKERGVVLPRRWKWGSNGIKFVRDTIGIAELSIEGFGIGGATVGKHFTHIILDDIIGKEAAYSPAVMQAAIDWVDNQRPLERPANKGCEAVIHTPWAYADCYAHKLKKWPNEYKVYIRHILEDPDGSPNPVDGASIMPSKYSTAEAKKLLKTDPFINASQFMCIPLAGREMSFSSEWLRFGQIVFSGDEPVFRIADPYFDPNLYDMEYEGSDPPPQWVPLSWMSKAILIDPIPGKPAELKAEPNCRHGLVAVGKDPWGRRYLFESAWVNETPEELFRTSMNLAEKWRCQRIAIEEVNFSYVFQPLFLRLAQDYPWQPDLVPTSPEGMHKDDRIKKLLQSPHEAGFWYYNREGTSHAVQQLTEFPHSGSKDVIDALSYTDKVLQRPETPTEATRAYYNQRAGETSRGITGYGVFT